MKNVLAVSIALLTLPVLVQAADITEAPSTTNANYVEPSVRMTIKPGMKIDHLFIRHLKQPYILQRASL